MNEQIDFDITLRFGRMVNGQFISYPPEYIKDLRNAVEANTEEQCNKTKD